MIFDKINFILNILSSNTLISGKQNLLKIFVADTISDTNIQTVEFRLQEKDGRNTSTAIIDWTEMEQKDTFFTYSFTPAFSKSTPVLLTIKITDYSDNNYIITANMQGEV